MGFKTKNQLITDMGLGYAVRNFIDSVYTGVVSVGAFGAKGDGVTDDTAAITAAWAAVDDVTKREQELSGEWADGDLLKTSWLFFPPGDYIFNGPALNVSDNFCRAMGASPRAVRIRLGSDTYLFDIDQQLKETHIENLQTSGGKGLFRHTYTPNNTTGFHVFRELTMLDYTECAIGSLSTNMPYWTVERCRFYGNASAVCGLALPQQMASGAIRDNAFMNNKYHLKAPLNDSNHVIGPNNTYLRAVSGGGAVAADVWLVGVGTGIDSRGDGLTFFGERFSNENMQIGDFRILIAEEDTGSGSNFMDRSHATTDVNNYVASGIRFSHCMLGGVGNPSSANKGFVFTYLANTGPIKFIENYISGGYFPYWLEFNSTPAQISLTRMSEVRGTQIEVETSKPLPSNFAGYVNEIDSDFGYRGTLGDIDIIPGGDYAYEDVLTTSSDPNNWGLGSGGGSAPTRVSATDVYGGSEAAEITFADESGNTQGGIVETNLVVGETIWMEADVRKGATNSLLSVRMYIQEAGGTAHTVKAVSIDLTDDWRRIRVPWTVNNDKSNLTLRFDAENRYSASTNKFRVGRAAVYRGNAPSFGRHVETTGGNAGAWDGAHLVLGVYHLWVDSTGDLRIKSGAPTSDTDGTVVGTQT